MAENRSIDVPEGLGGERLDVVLSRLFGFSRAFAQDIIDSGGALLGGKPGVNYEIVSLHIRHDLRYVHGTCERTVLFGTVPTTRYRPVRTHSDIPVTKSGM